MTTFAATSLEQPRHVLAPAVGGSHAGVGCARQSGESLYSVAVRALLLPTVTALTHSLTAYMCLQRMQVSAGGQRLVDCGLKVNTLEQVSDIPVLRAIAIPSHAMPVILYLLLTLCVSA